VTAAATSYDTVDALLERARRGLDRLSPRAAYQAWAHGAELVDIRPSGQRAAEGQVPGALLVERNVLEWRFDPTSPARLPEARGYDVQVIVLCSEGFTSSLAAAALQALGLRRATDVIGGFTAWQAAALPSFAGDGVTIYEPHSRVPGERPARVFAGRKPASVTGADPASADLAQCDAVPEPKRGDDESGHNTYRDVLGWRDACMRTNVG
jgi:rhodanese-related sulfurtransferase